MIIDTHMHIGPMAKQYVCDYSVERLVEWMDEAGITKCINPNVWGLTAGEYEYAFAYGHQTWEDTDHRIYAYHVYDPRRSEECLKLMEQYRKDPAYVGIKIHPADHKTAPEDESYRPMWDFAREHHLPVMAHTWDLTPNPKQVYAIPTRFEKYIAEYQDVTVTLGHSGGRPGGMRLAAEMGKKYKNMYFDTAGDIWPNGFLEFMVSQVGADHMLFSSDYAMMDFRLMKGVVIGADLTEEEKECIFYKNAQRIYHI